MSIVDNLTRVQDTISAACVKAGRSPSEVKLIAVSKTKSIDVIREAYFAGNKCFGENYVQELAEKMEKLPQAEWHFIGGLQSNKAKQIVGSCALIHSVDREKLAQELNKIAINSRVVQDVLIQVHIGGENTKQGVSKDGVQNLTELTMSFPGLRVRGLMALPPLSDSELMARRYFSEVRSVFDFLSNAMTPEQKTHFTEISLGTSSDYEWAILEGSTLVRVGTAIFGERTT